MAQGKDIPGQRPSWARACCLVLGRPSRQKKDGGYRQRCLVWDRCLQAVRGAAGERSLTGAR